MYPRQYNERKAFQSPGLVTASSPEWAQIQSSGYLTELADVNIVDPTENYGLFTVEGPVEVLGLYGVVTAVVNTAYAENFKFAFQNGSVAYTALTADVAITSVPVGATLAKTAAAATATTLLKPSEGSFAEMTQRKQHQGFLLNGKTGAGASDKCGLVCVVSHLIDGSADFDMKFYVHWVPLVPTAQVISGFTLISAA